MVLFALQRNLQASNCKEYRFLEIQFAGIQNTSSIQFSCSPSPLSTPIRAHNSMQSSLSKIEINSAIPSHFHLREPSQLDYYQLKSNCLPRKQLDWMDELVRFLRRRLRFIISSLRRLKSACRSCSVNKCDSLDSFPEFSSLL